jgi:hypothetical protein
VLGAAGPGRVGLHGGFAVEGHIERWGVASYWRKDMPRRVNLPRIGDGSTKWSCFLLLNERTQTLSRLRSKTSMATTHRCDELLPVVVSTVQFSAAAGLAPSS